MMRTKRVCVIALLAVCALSVAAIVTSYFNTGHEVIMSNVDHIPIEGGNIQFSGEPAVPFARILPGEARKVRILSRGIAVYDGGYNVVVRWQTTRSDTISFLARGPSDRIEVTRNRMIRRGTPPDSGFRRHTQKQCPSLTAPDAP